MTLSNLVGNKCHRFKKIYFYFIFKKIFFQLLFKKLEFSLEPVPMLSSTLVTTLISHTYLLKKNLIFLFLF